MYSRCVQVAEMTGRRGRVVSLPDGTVQYQLRSESDVTLEMLNLTEKRRFMDGEKNIAIISEAASSGISLQSDKRVKVRCHRKPMQDSTEKSRNLCQLCTGTARNLLPVATGKPMNLRTFFQFHSASTL